MITFATDLYAPVVRATKTVANLGDIRDVSLPARVGIDSRLEADLHAIAWCRADRQRAAPPGGGLGAEEADRAVGALVFAEFDPHPGDNSDEATAREPVAPAGSSAVADLTVEAAVSAARVPLGGTVKETITVRNAGPVSATGVDITDVLGVPARVQRVAGGAASCTGEEPLRCTVANLPAGATQQIVLVLRPLRPGVMLDAVGVSGAQLDPDYANNVGKTAAHVSTRSTVARIRIVAIRRIPASASGS